MRLLIVGSESDKTIIMEGLVPCVARIKEGEVVEIERRTDAGVLIEKWLRAAKHNPVAKKQILKFREKVERRRRSSQVDRMLGELKERGRVILSGVV